MKRRLFLGRVAMLLAVLPTAVPADGDATVGLYCPLAAFVARPYDAELARLAPWVKPLDTLAPPTNYEPETVLAWRKKLNAAQRETYANFLAAMKTDEGRRALEGLVQTMIDDWHGEGKYPNGLTPQDWAPYRDDAKTVDTFFAILAAKAPHLIGAMSNTFLSRLIGNQEPILLRSPEVVDKLLYESRLVLAFRAVAESKLGHPPVDRHPLYEVIPEANRSP